MNTSIQQQIVISGVGGQGVLFVTRLLAEAAIEKGLAVFTSETHGMAQRGGTVLSHLKIGGFASPLIRPRQADGLLALKMENIAAHQFFLKKTGWIVANDSGGDMAPSANRVYSVNAESLAAKIGDLRAVNLIMLGYAMTAISKTNDENTLFCGIREIRSVLEKRLAARPKMLAPALDALETGYTAQMK